MWPHPLSSVTDGSKNSGLEKAFVEGFVEVGERSAVSCQRSRQARTIEHIELKVSLASDIGLTVWRVLERCLKVFEIMPSSPRPGSSF